VPAGHHRKTPPRTLRLRRLRTPAGFALALGVGLAPAIPISASSQMMSLDKPVAARAASSASSAADAVRTDMRAASRSRQRLSALVPRPVNAAQPAARPGPQWTTARLNVWSGPGEDSGLLAVLDAAAKVRETGTVRGPWTQIAWKGRTAWVRAAYLARTDLARTDPTANVDRQQSAIKPADGPAGAPCPDGSAVETGLQANTVKLYRAVCAAFPAVTAWGGRSGSGGDHGAGKALDIMSTGALRDAIADYVRAHASEFGVTYVIRAQHIWSVERSSEGWRLMPDRGSATANHFDHVHVSVN
jgi:hypothetical protein